MGVKERGGAADRAPIGALRPQGPTDPAGECGRGFVGATGKATNETATRLRPE